MKSRFFFIHCKGELTPQTTIFKVYFGTSKRDASLLSWFTSLSKSSDYYFARDTPDVSEFLHNVAASMFPGVTLPMLYLSTLVVSPSVLKSYVLSDCYPVPAVTPAASSQLCKLDFHYYTKHRQSHE